MPRLPGESAVQWSTRISADQDELALRFDGPPTQVAPGREYPIDETLTEDAEMFEVLRLEKLEADQAVEAES